MAVITPYYRTRIVSILSRFSHLITNVYGLDKVFRILVYALSLIQSYIRRYHNNDNSSIIQPLNSFIVTVSDTRMAMRMFGIFPSILQAIIPEYNCTPISFLQNLTMIIYHPTELIYWLAAHQVIPLKSLTMDRFSRFSCQAWSIWIMIELYSILKSFNNTKVEDINPDDNCKPIHAQKLYCTYLQLVSQLCDLPMAIHWSLPNYPLPNDLVSLFGFVGGVLGYARMWSTINV